MSDAPRTGRRVTLAAAATVVLLALGAMLWPHGDETHRGLRLVVLDPSGRGDRTAETYPALAAFLAQGDGETPGLAIARTRTALAELLVDEPSYVLCPDGVALDLVSAAYVTVAAGRRAAPRNLRPRGVLVYRKAAGRLARPWTMRPGRTVLGDSLSLCSTGGWRQDEPPGGMAAPAAGCAWGPDPYDHGPALHAARLGSYDYALVRQWDAERFFAEDLLNPLEWGIEPVTPPVPDLVLLASRTLPAGDRLAVGEKLAGLGRGQDDESAVADRLRLSLDALRLVGFNLLIDPDHDLVRRNFPVDWPHKGN